MIQIIGFIIGTTLMYSTPLIYTALGGVISENSGVVNIGLEGMMYMGAFMGAAIGFYAGNAWIGFLAAGAAGALFGLLHALATVTFHAEHVVSGIAINFLGPGFALFLSRIMFNGATQTKSLALEDKIPRPLAGVFPQDSLMYYIFNDRYSTMYLAFILVFLTWFFLYKTPIGLRIRACGEHPKAADTLGINVYRVRYLAVALSGMMAGFGGASMSVAVVAQFRPTLISGQGFIALAAMIFGKWKPQGAMAACLLFGLAQGLVVYIGSTSLSVPSPILSMLPYVLTLIILIGVVGRSVAPSADGDDFSKEGR